MNEVVLSVEFWAKYTYLLEYLLLNNITVQTTKVFDDKHIYEKIVSNRYAHKNISTIKLKHYLFSRLSQDSDLIVQ